MVLKIGCFILFLFVAAMPLSAKSQQISLEKWMQDQAQVAQERMNQNISPPGTSLGVIIASPSRQDPDYYFHWIRDSALVMDVVMNSLPEGSAPSATLLQTFIDYLVFSRHLQLTATLTGLGEPRFNVDGTAFNGPWARPQNDGPALRVLTILRVKSTGPIAQVIVKDDLLYILAHFQEPSFDLWEEVKGDHFYTRLVQLAALRAALEAFDPGWNIPRQELQTATAILEANLDRHWRGDKKYFSVTLNRLEGAEGYKITDLDTAVILAALHAKISSKKFSIEDERILATAVRLEDEFARTYKINSSLDSAPYPIAAAIGRYNDDVYFGGNPWYLTTAAFAELNYRLALSLKKNKIHWVTNLNRPFFARALSMRGLANVGRLKVGLNLAAHPSLMMVVRKALQDRGDLFMARLRLHASFDGGMAEQFDRNNGQPISARDLTWSYASFLSAFNSRKALTNR